MPGVYELECGQCGHLFEAELLHSSRSGSCPVCAAVLTAAVAGQLEPPPRPSAPPPPFDYPPVPLDPFPFDVVPAPWKFPAREPLFAVRAALVNATAVSQLGLIILAFFAGFDLGIVGSSTRSSLQCGSWSAASRHRL